MHAVDYAIFLLRIGGAVVVLAGAYLTYRVWRPDADRLDADGLREHPGDPFARYPAATPRCGATAPSIKAGLS